MLFRGEGMVKHTDIIIVGGGVIGSSIAYNLVNAGYTGEMTIFEKDKLYEFASTPISAGGIRQLFTTAVNVQMGKYAGEKYSTFPEDIAISNDKAEIDFRQNGYLFLGKDEQGMAHLEKQAKLQHGYNINSEILHNEELLKVIPELNLDDIVGGLYSGEDGYLDPYSVMQGYSKKAKEMGANYIYEEVTEVTKDRKSVV